MLSVARQVPNDIIHAIGAAPEIGRRRWMELADLLKNGNLNHVLATLKDTPARTMSSDQRFQAAINALKSKPQKSSEGDPPRIWTPDDKRVRANLKSNGNTAILTLGATNGLEFAAYIADRLDELYEGFRRSTDNQAGD